MEGNFVNDELEGLSKIYFRNGTLNYIGYLGKGKKEGYGRLYNSIGKKVYEGLFHGGLPSDILCKIMRSNGGYSYVGGMRDGKKDGFGREYDHHGKIVLSGMYLNDESVDS